VLGCSLIVIALFIALRPASTTLSIYYPPASPNAIDATGLSATVDCGSLVWPTQYSQGTIGPWSQDVVERQCDVTGRGIRSASTGAAGLILIFAGIQRRRQSPSSPVPR
jgi:hypothetical protein